jgi:predicted SAM-dependent methyltransferase
MMPISATLNVPNFSEAPTNDMKDLSNVFKRYNLGCGTAIYQNFLNIGYWHHLQAGQIYKDLNGTQNTFMLNHNLTEGIPAHDGSLELVYHAHMLEHLTILEGISFIKECFRVLKVGGMMRVLVPDLELWSRAYLSNDQFFLTEYQKVLDKSVYVTPGAIFMGMLHNHEHKMGYDFETLKWLLETNGFGNITRTLYCDGALEELELIEGPNPLKAMESLCVECYK